MARRGGTRPVSATAPGPPACATTQAWRPCRPTTGASPAAAARPSATARRLLIAPRLSVQVGPSALDGVQRDARTDARRPPSGRAAHRRAARRRRGECPARWPNSRRVEEPVKTMYASALPQLVTGAARAWALRRGRDSGAVQATLLHGAWRWEPSRSLRYRLLLRLALTPAGEADAAVTYVRGFLSLLPFSCRTLLAAHPLI